MNFERRIICNCPPLQNLIQSPHQISPTSPPYFPILKKKKPLILIHKTMFGSMNLTFHRVEDIATYILEDDEILLEYSADGETLHVIENLIFTSPLTHDGTSKAKI
jgi:hypothetical protein